MATVTFDQSVATGSLESDRPSSVSSGNTDAWTSYNLDWLFDPDRIDHLPIEEQLKRYAHRDLKKTKIYKYATKIWGAPISRKRLIVAPPMYPGRSHKDGTMVTSELQPPVQVDHGPSGDFIQEQLEKDKVKKYKKWIDERKAFRKNLDTMGLDDEYLSRKPDKTALEKRVLRRMLDEKYPKRTPSPDTKLNCFDDDRAEFVNSCPPAIAGPAEIPKSAEIDNTLQSPPREDTPLEAILPDETPVVQRPSPVAIKIIEKFLHEKKLRLIDLFKSVDKDKNWKVSRDEFRMAIQKAKIPVSEVLLEDLILALDSDLNNELDYRELAKGMGLWKIEKRENKRKVLHSAKFSESPSKYSQLSGFESPDLERLALDFGKSNLANTSKLNKSGCSPVKNNRPATKGDGSVTKGDSSFAKGGDSSFTKGENSPAKGDRSITKDGSSPTKDDRFESTQEITQSTSRIKSALSTISSTSSSRLEPPPPDTREESRVFDSEEAMLDLRKRDREALSRLTSMKKGLTDDQKQNKKRGLSPAKVVIKTDCGYVHFKRKNVLQRDRAIDGHLAQSTLGGEVAEQVNRFRQLRFKEYNEICKLCVERNVPLTEGLLKRVLLYPPDKPHGLLKKKIRQPAMPLFSQHFADPPKEPLKQTRTPSQEEELSQKATKVKVAKDGKIEVYVDSRRAYPKRSKVAPIPHKMTLSSGKAIIRRQVDCWLTFEEYERLTRHLATRYVNIYGHTDANAFWPGHLLDKIRIVLPDGEPFVSAIWRNTAQPYKRSNFGSDNDLRIWPVNERGYVQYGSIS